MDLQLEYLGYEPYKVAEQTLITMVSCHLVTGDTDLQVLEEAYPKLMAPMLGFRRRPLFRDLLADVAHGSTSCHDFLVCQPW